MLKKKSVLLHPLHSGSGCLPASAGIDQHEHYKQEHDELSHTPLVGGLLNNVQAVQVKTEMVPVNV